MIRRRRVASLYAPRTPPDVGRDPVLVERTALAVRGHLEVLGLEMERPGE